MVDVRTNVVPMWMALVRDAVEKFKEASVEEQEVICVGVGQKCGTKAAERKARELFAAVRPKPELKPEPKPELQYKNIGGVLHYSAGAGWRRWIGPPPKQAVEKPTDVEMSAADVVGMSVEEVAAELVGDTVEVKGPPGVKVKAGLKATSKAFQHSKNPVGIPASLENAIMAVAMLRLQCRYDLFHDRNIVCKHDCGVKGDDDFEQKAKME